VVFRGEAAAEAAGEAGDAGEISGEAPGDGEVTASAALGLDARVPAKVADGACPCAIAEKARLALMRTTAFIKVTSSSKPARCRFASALFSRLPKAGCDFGHGGWACGSAIVED